MFGTSGLLRLLPPSRSKQWPRHIKPMKVLVTGASGFICGYLIDELLKSGYEVVGLDNFSKYGRVVKSYDTHPRYTFVEADAKDVDVLKELLSDCDHFAAAAAMIGGISYFHEFAYDLLPENERITAAAFDAAIHAHQRFVLRKITVLSSSMVFENTNEFPTPEGAERRCPPPTSTYGFQKLATEYFAHGAWQQYRLPFTIARPFNCVGTGEKRALKDRDISSGNIKLAMSHVVPDLAQKILKGQDPLHILGSGNQVRHYTYGGDLARGIRLCIEHPAAENQDFNLSTPVRTTVLELAELIWTKIHGKSRPFRYVSDPPYQYDVQERSPDVQKAATLLDFRAGTGLSEILDEVIPWIEAQIKVGQI
jgi:UDP-glucose 4-epimerase